MLVNSFMNKSVTKFLVALLFALFTLPTSNAMVEMDTKNDKLELYPFYNELDPVVYDAAYALRKLMSYYKLWYRFTRAIFRKKSKLCLLTIEPRRRLCARIFISIVRNLENAKINDILRYGLDPKPCQKEVIRTPKDDGKIWKSKKSMIFCQSFYYPMVIPTSIGFAVAMTPAPGIHVSAAQKKNAVFVFVRNSKTDNLEIYKYIENLAFEQEDATESTKVKTT